MCRLAQNNTSQSDQQNIRVRNVTRTKTIPWTQIAHANKCTLRTLNISRHYNYSYNTVTDKYSRLNCYLKMTKRSIIIMYFQYFYLARTKILACQSILNHVIMFFTKIFQRNRTILVGPFNAVWPSENVTWFMYKTSKVHPV